MNNLISMKLAKVLSMICVKDAKSSYKLELNKKYQNNNKKNKNNNNKNPILEKIIYN